MYLEAAVGDIKAWAEQYNVRVRRDGCGEHIVPSNKKWPTDMPDCGEYHSHVYDNGDGRFGVCLLFLTPKRWGNAKRRLATAGFQLVQDADAEGCLLFDPQNVQQSRLALKQCGVKARRKVSETRLAQLALAGQQTRFLPGITAQDRGESVLETPQDAGLVG